LADGTYWVYHYDNLGQVVSGKRFWSDGTLMAGQDFDYKFDDIGNRDTTGGRASAVSDYTANQLNQYTQRTAANKLDVLGIANPTAGVEVWKDSDSHSTATQKGEYFHYALTASNDTYPLVYAKSLYGATQQATVGRSYVPPATESFTYDTDGNLTADGRWTSYVWDGENRLIEMRRDTSTPTEARQKLTFEYDHLGRRIRKTYFTYSGGWVEQRDTTYLYDGWNIVAEVDANNANATLRTYVWGTDLSGNRTGAGGVGGLLWVNNVQSGLTAGIQFAAYDGNGNVAGLFAASDGSNTARYEYGPFGEPLRLTGSLAKANPVRWSTKVTDDEGGLVYYGYRYYNPTTGRWPSRDPFAENGGLNLYGFTRNNPINYVDTDGRQIFPPYQPPPPRPPPGKPNEESFYNVHYSKNSITLNFHACCNCDELRDRLYGDLKTFKDWGKNSVASINVSGDTASFYPGLGVAAGGGLAGNDGNWRVRLSNDDSTHCVSARTLDDHPLVGVRKWCASLSKKGTTCVITITTEAYERPRNWQNYIGGQWFGRDDQRQIWEDYFGNIAGAYKDDSCFQSSQRGTPVQRDTGSTINPWVP
jgi:RHS repeat-associated protein